VVCTTLAVHEVVGSSGSTAGHCRSHKYYTVVIIGVAVCAAVCRIRRNHRQYAQGRLALDVNSDSQQTLNEWFRTNLPYSLALPASLPAPGEERPYRLEGARLLPVGNKTATYIAYQMQSGPVSLMVAPDSVAVASGGVRVDYRKVSFHYETVEGYKVVTWSQHGLTYAEISHEGNSTQQSCMVCHSAMRDRDLTQTPTPLRDKENTVRSVWQ
jgi:hypothetical protein